MEAQIKIATILSELSVSARPLDFWFENIYQSSRGLTGSDLSFVRVSEELAKNGHEVSLFTVHAQPLHKPNEWRGVKLYNTGELPHIVDDSFDAILSINDPNVFFYTPKKPKRICWEFLNDFPFARPGFDDNVDLWLSVCEEHRDYLFTQLPTEKATDKSKWRILPLGCDPESYDPSQKVRGRMIYCSSPDRGLHWALQAFQMVKREIPETHLKVFYHSNNAFKDIDPMATNIHPHVVEMGNRLRYIDHAMKRLKPLGVEHIGSVSADQMREEMSQAELLLYPCDTLAFSEGFSLSIMQSHAAGAIPAITSVDCLGGIYRDSGCLMVDAPMTETKLKEYAEKTVQLLKDQELMERKREQCIRFAKGYQWNGIVKKLEELIKT